MNSSLRCCLLALAAMTAVSTAQARLVNSNSDAVEGSQTITKCTVGEITGPAGITADGCLGDVTGTQSAADMRSKMDAMWDFTGSAMPRVLPLSTAQKDAMQAFEGDADEAWGASGLPPLDVVATNFNRNFELTFAQAVQGPILLQVRGPRGCNNCLNSELSYYFFDASHSFVAGDKLVFRRFQNEVFGVSAYLLPVPEPSIGLLAFGGLAMLTVALRRRRR